eukprot:3796936-Rhodomonas_salina.1
MPEPGGQPTFHLYVEPPRHCSGDFLPLLLCFEPVRKDLCSSEEGTSKGRLTTASATPPIWTRCVDSNQTSCGATWTRHMRTMRSTSNPRWATACTSTAD